VCHKGAPHQFAYGLLLLHHNWRGVADSRVIPLRKERAWAYKGVRVTGLSDKGPKDQKYAFGARGHRIDFLPDRNVMPQ
jgi:hypothetical protein